MSVVVLAGRRIGGFRGDAPFPARRLAPMRSAIRRALQRARATTLIASAANGADLLALGEAAALGVATRIVLPFDAARFRRTSVADRPGDWGRRFDAALAHAVQRIILRGGDEDAYYAATRRLIAEAQAERGRKTAIVVWEGEPRGGSDHTNEFRTLARGAGFALCEVRTR